MNLILRTVLGKNLHTTAAGAKMAPGGAQIELDAATDLAG